MHRKMVAVWVSLVFMLSNVVIIIEIAPSVSGAVITVDDDAPADFSKIQDAINASNDGDTVFVHSGTYYENLIIEKTINLIGENKNKTIINGQKKGDVIRVSAHWVNVSGFTITQSGYNAEDAGLELHHVNNCRIFDNVLSDNNLNIFFYTYGSSSKYNIITHNKIYNGWIGIYLRPSSNNNIISNNNISSNKRYGISIYASSHNIISDNTISYSKWVGIYSSSSLNNTFTNNTLIDDGIFLFGTKLTQYNSHNIPTNNLVNGKPIRYYKNCRGINIDGDSLQIGQLILANSTEINVINLKINNIDVGIEIAYSTNISIKNSIVDSNDWIGIFSYSSSHNVFYENNITNNNYYGIFLVQSYNNMMYHNNIIDNIPQAHDSNSTYNYWNHPLLLEGNYWSNYKGEDCGNMSYLWDSVGKHLIGGDGIGDTFVPFPKASFDYYPLMAPWNPDISIIIDIDPDTINLKSKGKWITCYIDISDYDVSDILIDSVMFEDTIPAEWGDIQGKTLMVKFDRSEVEELLSPGTYVFKITGELIDGTKFEGYSDEIKVIDPPKK